MRYSPLLYCGGDRMNLLFDRCAHVFGEQILLFEGFPLCDRTRRRLDRKSARVGLPKFLRRRQNAAGGAIASPNAPR